MKLLLISVLAVAMIGLMIPSAFSVTSEQCSQTVTTSGNSNPDCLDPSKIEKPKSAMTKLGSFTYEEKPNYYGYAGVFKFLDWGMIPATDGNYKILVLRGEITANTGSMKKGEGLITTPEGNFAIYNNDDRGHLDTSGYSEVSFDWKSDFTTPTEFFLTAEMYPETHYTNPLQLYYSPVFSGIVITSKNIHLDNLENLPYLELCHDVSKTKICGLDISLKDIRIEEGNQKDLLIVELNNELSQSSTQIKTESGLNSNANSHHVYPYSCPFGIPSNPFEIPQKCDMSGETKVKNPEWTFWEECLSSNTKKLCFVIEKSDNSFSVSSFSKTYEINNYEAIFSMETDRELIKKSITKPSSQSSSTNENERTQNIEGIIVEKRNYDSMNFSIKVPPEWNEEYLSEDLLFIEGPSSSLLIFHMTPVNESLDNFELLITKKMELMNYENIRIIDKSTVTEGDFTKTYSTITYELENNTIVDKIIMITHNDQMWIIEFMSFDDSIFYTSQSFHALHNILKNSFTILDYENMDSFVTAETKIEGMKLYTPETNPETTPVPPMQEVTSLKINSDKEYYVVGDKVWIEGVALSTTSNVNLKIIDPEGNLVKMFQSDVMKYGNFDAVFYIEKQFFPLAGGYDIIAWQSSASEDTDVINIKIGIKGGEKKLGVPAWIKNNADWWAKGAIDDDSFVQGIQFMIKENIISIPNLPESSSETAESVPAWIKNNAGWWAEGQIDDNSFVKGIEYLVKVGIIQVN